VNRAARTTETGMRTARLLPHCWTFKDAVWPPCIDDMVRRTILYGSMPSVARKKTYNLDEELIGRARRVLEARTDTETIQRALRKVVEDAQIEEALGAVLAQGRFRTVFR